MSSLAETYLKKIPELLRFRYIGSTMTYILRNENKNVGFVSQEIINKLFKQYTNFSFDDACKSISTTPADFFDKHFSEYFKNCHPHGLARLELVNNKPAAVPIAHSPQNEEFVYVYDDNLPQQFFHKMSQRS